MSENIHESFLDFLYNTPKIRTLAEQAIHRGEKTLKIDIQDVNAYSFELYTEIVRNFSRIMDKIDKSTALFSAREFSTSLEHTSFFNNHVVYGIRDLKGNKLGQLVSFCGTVTRTTQVRPELISGSFTCKTCGCAVIGVLQEFKYTEPLTCPNHLCTNRKLWKLDIDRCLFSNWQRVHVQENANEIPPGALPRNIDVVVRNDLVEKVRAGEKIIMTGYPIVVPDVIQLMMPQSRIIPVQVGASSEVKKKRNINIRDLNYKLSFMCIHTESDVAWEEFTNEEMATINEMRSSSDLYHKLSQSMFPSIRGHYSVKNAILLLLAGGVQKKAEGGTKLRGDINILLVGDPGTAKSRFLEQTSKLLPRSVYTSGKSTSAAGLTASVVKDGETGEFTIEAGALMLSDNGVCCIDEFDKMNLKDQVSIHEAMEQQTITISKAGINATFNARASVLAAANPVRGRYNKKRTLRQNINLSPPIISRFDLYFVLIDEMSMENDRNVATHILNNHASFWDNSLVCGYFTQEQVKLYLKYVRGKIPRILDEAKIALIEKYVSIRQESLIQDNNYMMTVRSLESMIRLSEALAKIHDSEFVTRACVDEAYRLIKSSIMEVRGEDVEISPQTGVEPAVMINSKDYTRITSSFVYLIKTREPMRRHELIDAFLVENESMIESEIAYMEERSAAERVLSFLIGKEGILFISEGYIYIHPDYDI